MSVFKIFLYFFLIFIASFSTIAKEISTSTVRADSHAPISVMCDHYHKKGEIMWSDRYMLMDMDG